MKSEHIIIGQVMNAKSDSRAADDLVRQYIPFIKAETLKFSNSSSLDYEDCLSIAMFAFHEAVIAYSKSKGAFLKFASVVIKNRLIDYKRKESRHNTLISLEAENSEEDDRTFLNQEEMSEDNVAAHHNSLEAKREILEFSEALQKLGLELAEIADNCPKQERTLKACLQVLEFAKKREDLIALLETTGKLPITQLSEGSGISRKLLERHRKYLVAILLAYTNGFEIIRGHLKQLAPMKGESVQ